PDVIGETFALRPEPDQAIAFAQRHRDFANANACRQRVAYQQAGCAGHRDAAVGDRLGGQGHVLATVEVRLVQHQIVSVERSAGFGNATGCHVTGRGEDGAAPAGYATYDQVGVFRLERPYGNVSL